MENPEEVLQALDEFQKMRPSEIPRELEDYLSWVAKTGDPVYQWSLVKPLFREKLTRVMTDFYESCPSLELGPCPNVEQFNYDIMKCNLLELLESFANAPFTVQRICELITSPRKEYNRVDKFMRAIEKNILVVSTIEPGPTARRSENGDGMVNGSLDDEPTSDQATHEVEMESWVKDCASENSVSGESENPQDVSDEKLKIPQSEEEISSVEEKPQNSNSGGEIADSTLEITSETTGAESGDKEASCVENLSTNGAENSASTCEIAETVMNEDTSSQPSLDSESDESDIASGQKLQTTFHTKDFVKSDCERAEKFYSEGAAEEAEKKRIEEEDIEHEIANREKTEKEISEEKDIDENSDNSSDPVQPEKRARLDIGDADKPTEDDDSSSKISSTVMEKSDLPESSVSEDNADCPESDKLSENPESTCEERLTSEEETKILTEDEETRREEDSLPEADRPVETSENSKPIVEEPSFEEEAKKESAETRESGVTIEEAMDDDTRINKSIIPDPIPIVEEPKEEQAEREVESTTEITEITKAEVAPTSSEDIASSIVVDETSTIENVSEETSVLAQETSPEDITDVRSIEEADIDDKIIVEPAESMEIDGEESLPAFQQDEPMEQETGDMVKS